MKVVLGNCDKVMSPLNYATLKVIISSAPEACKHVISGGYNLTTSHSPVEQAEAPTPASVGEFSEGVV